MLAAARALLAHAAPIFIAQVASIGMMVVDTAVLGHVAPDDLAAVAIGGGIHVSIIFALVGILQAVGPLAAHALGGGRQEEAGHWLRQALGLAVLLSLPGGLLLNHVDGLLAAAGTAPEVAGKVGGYLGVLTLGLLPALAYRTFYAYCNALGRPRVLMMIGLASLAVHALLAWGFAMHGWLGVPQGVVGCAVSNVIIGWGACLAAALYVSRAATGSPLRGSYRPLAADWRRLLRLGVPMGVSNFVEITSFTLISLLIASLGATVVAGHRIVANLAALCYMLPLALGIAALAGVGRAMGAGLPAQAGRVALAAGALAVLLSSLMGGLVWWQAEPLIAAYTDDDAVLQVGLGLIGYVALYQFFDAMQTVAGHVLRALHVSFLPMLVQIFCFWGLGLGGGWWLCYRAPVPMGAAGFWLASLLSLVAAAGLLVPLAWYGLRGRLRELL